MNQQQRLRYMKAMGIPIWLARNSDAVVDEITEAQDGLTESQIQSVTQLFDNFGLEEKKPQPSSLSSKQISDQAPPEQIPAVIKALPADEIATLNWNTLQRAAQKCQFCEMRQYRSHVVFGSGNAAANWMFIGEAPDVEDDKQGLPFLDKSGQLLDNILAALNLDRQTVYLTNILKCRPPNDRDPHVDEAQQCMNYLYRQIELIQPKVIVVVGLVATRHLLKVKLPLGKMRGTIHYLEHSNTPVVVTYHPRYLLRQPTAKRKLWKDLRLAQSVINT